MALQFQLTTTSASDDMTSSDNIALADGMPVLARGMTVLPAELLSKLLT